jgi:hypothetical protein
VSQHSNWHAIGCRRGTLKSNITATVLCPKQAHRNAGGASLSKPDLQSLVNDKAEKILKKRAAEMCRFDELVARKNSQDDTFHQVLEEMGYRGLQNSSSISSTQLPSQATLIPLDQCIFSIIWEFSYLPPPARMLNDRTLGEVVNLLHAAARYQACLETVGPP